MLMKKKLDQLIMGLEVVDTFGDIEGTEVSELAYDSRKISSGSLYFCVPGQVTDGHEFAGEAVDLGATGLVCEHELGLDVAQVVVKDARAAMATVATRFFEEPTRTLKLAGVTGTNGKTTTTHILREMVEAGGSSCGLLGTVEQIVGGVREPVERTTPEAIDLQRVFRRMIESGDSACVMEVSSHALELHRSDKLDFDVAVFTNLSQDHLDFHGTMDAYFSAKRALFFPPAGRQPAVAVVNADDRYGRQLIDELKSSGRKLISYGIEDRDADFCVAGIEPGSLGRRFELVTGDRDRVKIETNLLGLFNVYNVLAALAAAEGLGIDRTTSIDALRSTYTVPGRFEPVDEGQQFKVLVDYAHTPDSLENILSSAAEITDNRVISVFGCGGDRDRGKRPLMGEVACRLSDLVFITSDNPRNEQPEQIIDEILVGAQDAQESGQPKLVVEPDRRKAIAAALKVASAGDTVVIAGKGHETGQEFERGRKMEFDDRVVAAEELRRMK